MAKNEQRKRRQDGPAAPAPAPGGARRLPALDGPAARWLLIAGLLLLALAILYPDAVLRGQVFLSADSSNAEGFSRVGDDALADGHYPLWNPYIFTGMPSFGSLAYVRFLYPPSVVFGFLQQKLGFVPLTWLLAHLLFGGLGMAWLLSRWKLPTAALVLGAVVWLLFPKVVAWGVHGHGSKLGAAMYLPWIVGWTWRILDGGRLRAAAMLGLLLGLQLLRGHVQITYYTLLTVGWLSVWNAVWPLDAAARRLTAATRWRSLTVVVAGLALGFAIGGILLLPVHEYSGLSIRGQDTAGGGGVGLDYATGWSLAPAELGTLVLPGAAGFGKATYLGHMPFTDYPNYLGALILVLAALTWRRRAASATAALAAMALLAVLVSFGNLGGGLYDLLYRFLPFFNKFRIPSMILILPAFAAAILAARGAAAWCERLDGAARPWLLPAVLAGLGALALILSGGREAYLGGLRDLAAAAQRQAPDVLLEEAWQLHHASLVRIGLVLLTAGAACLYAARNGTFRRRGLLWVLALLVGYDLLGVDRLIVRPELALQQIGRDAAGRGVLVPATRMVQPYRPQAGPVAGPAAAALKEAVGHDRVWPLGSYGGQNLWMTDGIRSLGGYHPAKLAAYEQIRKRLLGERPAGRLANWLAGSVVAFEGDLAGGGLELLAALGADLDPQPLRAGGPWFYRNRSALPRARLLSRWQPVSALPEGDALEPFLDAVQAGSLDLTGQVFLDRVPEPLPQEAAQPLPIPEFVTDGLDEVVLTVAAPVPALLLLADMNVPGWRVEVDGAPAPLLTADLVLRAVALEAGEHTVRFHYRDPAVRSGLALTAGGLVLVAVLLLLPVLRRRRFLQSKDVTEHE